MPFQRHGVKLSAATMGDWIAKVATYLGPLGDALRKEVLRSGYLQVDETMFPVQKPKKKGVRQANWQGIAGESPVI